jgi:hypothetical protein
MSLSYSCTVSRDLLPVVAAVLLEVVDRSRGECE